MAGGMAANKIAAVTASGVDNTGLATNSYLRPLVRGSELSLVEKITTLSSDVPQCEYRPLPCSFIVECNACGGPRAFPFSRTTIFDPVGWSSSSLLIDSGHSGRTVTAA